MDTENFGKTQQKQKKQQIKRQKLSLALLANVKRRKNTQRQKKEGE